MIQGASIDLNSVRGFVKFSSHNAVPAITISSKGFTLTNHRADKRGGGSVVPLAVCVSECGGGASFSNFSIY